MNYTSRGRRLLEACWERSVSGNEDYEWAARTEIATTVLADANRDPNAPRMTARMYARKEALY